VTVTTDFTSLSQRTVHVIFLLNILTVKKKASEVTIFLGCGTMSVGEKYPMLQDCMVVHFFKDHNVLGGQISIQRYEQASI
jgi:hypothetical protein